VRGVLAQLSQDGLDDALGVRQHVVVPEAQNAPASRFKPNCAPAVGLAFVVLAAIGFYDQTMARTGKVGDVSTDRKLPAKAVAA
jgi:hypothetical protein